MNKAIMFEKPADELIELKKKLITEMSHKLDEMAQKRAHEDCHASPNDGCKGCEVVEKLDDEVTSLDLKIDDINEVLTSNAYAVKSNKVNWSDIGNTKFPRLIEGEWYFDSNNFK